MAIYEYNGTARSYFDTATNLMHFQFWDSTTPAWVDAFVFNVQTGIITIIGTVTANMTINKSIPTTTYTGSEASGTSFSTYEDAGTFQIYDVTNSVSILKVQASKPVIVDIPVPIIFEVPQNGLVATAVATVFTSQEIVPPLANYASVSIESTFTSTATDNITQIAIYDTVAAAILESVSGNVGTNSVSVYSAITKTNPLVVQINITTLSATSGATTSVPKAILHFRYTLS